MSQEKRRPIILSEKHLHSPGIRGKVNVKNGWVTCPVCNRNHRLLRINEDTEAKGLPVYCRCCKAEVILNIGRGQST
ncbi:cysteine-rich KTR domain-containing protein [Oscillospiraceae bacterium 38-13]